MGADRMGRAGPCPGRTGSSRTTAPAVSLGSRGQPQLHRVRRAHREGTVRPFHTVRRYGFDLNMSENHTGPTLSQAVHTVDGTTVVTLRGEIRTPVTDVSPAAVG